MLETQLHINKSLTILVDNTTIIFREDYMATLEDRAKYVITQALSVDKSKVSIAEVPGGGAWQREYSITLNEYNLIAADPASVKVLKDIGATVQWDGRQTKIGIRAQSLQRLVESQENELRRENSVTNERAFSTAEADQMMRNIHIDQGGYISTRATIQTEGGPIEQEMRTNYGTSSVWTGYRKLDPSNRQQIADASYLLTLSSRTDTRTTDRRIEDAQAALGFAGKPWNDPGFVAALQQVAIAKDNKEMRDNFARIGEPGARAVNFFHVQPHKDDLGETVTRAELTPAQERTFDAAARTAFLDELRKTGREDLAASLGEEAAPARQQRQQGRQH